MAFAAFIFMTMTTWKTGRKLVFESVSASNLDLKEFVNGLLESDIHKTYGTAIYMNSVVGKTSIEFQVIVPPVNTREASFGLTTLVTVIAFDGNASP